jgi:hypothetical protein
VLLLLTRHDENLACRVNNVELANDGSGVGGDEKLLEVVDDHLVATIGTCVVSSSPLIFAQRGGRAGKRTEGTESRRTRGNAFGRLDEGEKGREEGTGVRADDLGELSDGVDVATEV